MNIHPLKIYCLKNKIKQKKLAELVGISEITIHRIVNYKTKLYHKKTIQKLHAFTGIPINDLIYKEASSEND
ncbi:MAG: helix-turn-helix domain-containing protein [bacterium]|jgi:DNA-binding Xre family transcriptional regulator